MNHHRYTLRRTKPWSAACRIERISGAMSGRSFTFTGIPTLDAPILAFTVVLSKSHLLLV